MSLDSNKQDTNFELGERATSSLFFYGEDKPEETGSVPQIFVMPQDMEEHRLDFALSRLMGISRVFAQKLIKDGNVQFNPQRRVKPSMKVAENDIVSVAVPPIESLDLEPKDVPFDVIYADDDIIVINKPAGLVVHPAPGHWDYTLVHGLLYRYPDLGSLNGVKRPGIVHRLDATTSGLMVVARNGLAQEGLFRDFKARRVDKEYLALCYGVPPAAKGEIHYPIGRDPYNRLRMAVVEDGRESWTDFKVVWSNQIYSFVRCKLHSGRTHQIRVHMQAIRCPLVGDRLYAPSRKSPFGEERIFLHSWKLSFKHPRTGLLLSFTQSLPSELADFLRDIFPKNRARQ